MCDIYAFYVMDSFTVYYSFMLTIETFITEKLKTNLIVSPNIIGFYGDACREHEFSSS